MADCLFSALDTKGLKKHYVTAVYKVHGTPQPEGRNYIYKTTPRATIMSGSFVVKLIV